MDLLAAVVDAATLDGDVDGDALDGGVGSVGGDSFDDDRPPRVVPGCHRRAFDAAVAIESREEVFDRPPGRPARQRDAGILLLVYCDWKERQSRPAIGGSHDITQKPKSCDRSLVNCCNRIVSRLNDAVRFCDV